DFQNLLLLLLLQELGIKYCIWIGTTTIPATGHHSLLKVYRSGLNKTAKRELTMMKNLKRNTEKFISPVVEMQSVTLKCDHT
ncbi:Hypothetical predicted protein, partial [Paramuricea clavata]